MKKADNNFIFKYDEMKAIQLQDGKGETGGISYRGETLFEFVNEVFDLSKGDQPLIQINKGLKECGIKPLKVEYEEGIGESMAINVNGKILFRKMFIDNGFIYKIAKPWKDIKDNEYVYSPQNYGITQGYTKKFFIKLCCKEFAEDLFNALEWQHPSTLWEEWLNDDKFCFNIYFYWLLKSKRGYDKGYEQDQIHKNQITKPFNQNRGRLALFEFDKNNQIIYVNMAIANKSDLEHLKDIVAYRFEQRLVWLGYPDYYNTKELKYSINYE